MRMAYWGGRAMALELFELGGRDGQRYSQFSWRTTLALAHKGLKAEHRPVRVSDKEAIAFSSQDKVPILTDSGEVISDSWRIAEHLESRYPDTPSLFGGETGHGLARFINAWVDRTVIGRLVPLLAADLVPLLDDADARHLRSQFERFFGKPLEQLAASRETDIVAFRRLLDPARAVMRAQPFLSGANPAYADYILFSLFQWARIVSPFEVLEPGDALAAWRARMLDLFGGLARTQTSFAKG
jgi:glutathione S-transferase